jgi:hypothetical protein
MLIILVKIIVSQKKIPFSLKFLMDVDYFYADFKLCKHKVKKSLNK